MLGNYSIFTVSWSTSISTKFTCHNGYSSSSEYSTRLTYLGKCSRILTALGDSYRSIFYHVAGNVNDTIEVTCR